MVRIAACATALLSIALYVSSARADDQGAALPSPLTLAAVQEYARVHRAEIEAARARARAAAERPAIVSALEDPMFSPSLDHLPFMLHGADYSLSVEQRFPLSRELGNKRRVAEADAQRLRADAERVRLDVELDAVSAFFMLHEQQQMTHIAERQLEIARQLVDAAGARYAGGTGTQAEVLRAELEVARIDGGLRASRASIEAAQAMLNAALGRPVDAALPPLDATVSDALPIDPVALRKAALRNRPELAVGSAEVRRANAEISVMDSMDAPMAMVRTGPAYTMTDGFGWMVMVGVTIPIWRERRDASIREAEAMAAMARADLRAMTRMVEGDVAAARGLVLAARERYVALRDEVLPRAHRTLAPTLASYAAGTVSLVSVMEAVQSVWTIEGELLAAQVELGMAWARLLRATGAKEGGRP